MAIADDISVALNGDVRYTGDPHGGGAPGYYTVIEFHRWLQDLADDAVASGDDLVDITSDTPSDRSTDNIITLNGVYNIDDTLSEHLYDGSITQSSGNTVYSGLVVVGTVNAGTELQLVQNNTILTNYWTTGLNIDIPANILLRIMVKTRDAGTDIDGKRLRVQARELGDTYAEFSLTAGLGNSTAAVFTSTDLNNQTVPGTISGWSSIINTEGYQGLDVTGDAIDEYYYSQWDLGTQTINDLYERTKWLSARGTAQTLYGMNGELFRGITHSFAYNTGVGTFTENEILTFGNGATGALLALDDQGVTGNLYIQLLTGDTPTTSDTITGGTSLATALVDGVVTPRTVNPEFLGTSTGSAIIGAYGIGVDPTDLTASDQLFDLSNTLRVPPNNVQFTVNGLVVSEDYVLVGPEAGGILEEDQFSLQASLVTDNITSVQINTTIPSDTPATGYIRVQDDNGVFRRLHYSSFATDTFVIDTTDGNEDFLAVPATAANNVFIAYLDILATSTSENFTAVYSADRALFIRVRDGGVTPIKTFETTGTLGSAGGTTTVIRTSDA